MKTIIFGLIQSILIFFLVIIAIVTFGTKVPLLSRLGLNFFYVISGSMEPTIPTGALIYSGKYKLDDLKKKDIITFYSRDAKSGAVTVVTHRIVDVIKSETIEKIGEKGKEKDKKILKYEFATKGDANNTIDQRLVPSSNILGLYKWHIPKIGYIAYFTQTPKGFALMIILPTIVIIFWEIFDVVLHFKKKYEEKSKKEIERLKKELAKSKK